MSVKNIRRFLNEFNLATYAEGSFITTQYIDKQRNNNYDTTRYNHYSNITQHKNIIIT